MNLLEYPIAKGVRAFSTRREGGFSRGKYASFNANAFCGDKLEAVEKNRQLLIAELGIAPDRLIIPHQVHRTEVRLIDEDFLDQEANIRAEELEGVDALITALPGVCLCVSTADCIPVVLYDPAHHAIACIHAGWRGTQQRIVEQTLAAMRKAFGTKASDCHAAIGPGISVDSFEVGDEVYEAFRQGGFEMDRIARRKGKWHIDLPLSNRLQLRRKGVKAANIHMSGICTYQNYKEFFSARRLGIRSGRILTGILQQNEPTN